MNKPHFYHKLFATVTFIVLISFSIIYAKPPEAKKITITCGKLDFSYDIKEFTVEAGQKIHLTLYNPTNRKIKIPHNLLILKRGTLDAMVELLNSSFSSSGMYTVKNGIPKSKDILFSIKSIKPGKRYTLSFTAPSEPGAYPYLCAHEPLHWVASGVMHVK